MPDPVTRCAAVAVALAVLFPLTGFAQNPSRQRLDSDLKKVESDVASEEERASKKASEIEAEYARAKDPAVQATLAAELTTTAKSHLTAILAGEDTTAKKVTKDLVPLLKEKVGPNLADVLAEPLAHNLIASVDDKDSIRAAEAISSTIDDVFTEGTFAGDYELLKPALYPRLKTLLEKRSELNRRIEELERRENSMRAGIPPEMVQVPAGTYPIGLDDSDIMSAVKTLGYSDAKEVIRWWSGYPSIEKELAPYFIDVNEVTCAWYAEYLATHETARVPSHWDVAKRTYPEGWENRPVTGISYEDALGFCRWMGRRLPTEFEWEAAARFGANKKDLRLWPWGDKWDPSTPFCNGNTALGEGERRRMPPHLPPLLPVGFFAMGKSALGANDFSGNAYEITSSPFVPYAGFKDKTVDKVRWTQADFNGDQIVLRGGDCNKRDVVVSTTWRLGIQRTEYAPFVGFRTAASSIRGKDHVDAMTEDRRLRRYLVNINNLPSETLARKTEPTLAWDDPTRYGSIMAGGWDQEKNLPAEARHITVINRDAEDLRDHSWLRSAAQKEPIMLAYLALEVPSVEPALPAGEYFIYWQNSFLEKIEETPASANGEEAPDAPKRPKPRNTKPEKPKQREVPEAYVFVKMGAPFSEGVRLESFPPPVNSDVQPTRVMCNAENDTVDLVLSFPSKFNKKQNFVMTLRLKLEDGTGASFR